ncbi:MAG: hypothetical protein EOM15_05475, partial [Spirochaetia bacterium]|nr:hypothetical protein [Spirochaetia bacterium]
MNTKLQKEIQQALDGGNTHSAEAIIQALMEAGATPKYREEILDVLRTNNMSNPEALYYQFADRQAEHIRRQEEAANKLEIMSKLEQQKTIISETIAKNGVKLADLTTPLQDLVSLQKEIGRLQDSTRGSILIPATKAEILQEIENKPEALETGYKLGQDKLSFQTGGFSIVAAPTGHGKTTILINLLLDLARQYPTKRHWLFSYEEGRAAITIKALNAYCNHD